MKSIKRLLLVVVLLVGVIVLYLLLWPVPINPQTWTPPQAPTLTGTYQQNNALSSVERLSLGEGFAPEDVAIDAENRLYAGMDDGRIVRVKTEGGSPEVFVNTRGRPLGLIFDTQGNLIVADAINGLLSISKDGVVSTIATEAEGVAFKCTNDLDVAGDGTIYFTDASSKFPLTNFRADLIEHGPNGRLLAYDPKTKTANVLLRNLSFANGVAVSPDQSFVLVAETGKYRLHRVWLNGPKTGQSDIFIDNLPGFPDGLSSNRRDKFWLALVSPRDQTLDKLLPRPFLRKVVIRLPTFLQPAAKRYSFVLGLDISGQVVANLQDPSPQCYAQIANALEHDGSLYFGSIGESTVGRYRLASR